MLYLLVTSCFLHAHVHITILYSRIYRAHFPSESVHVLTDHAEEVWYVKFSHDGTRLASASKDGQAIIWDVTVRTAICVWQGVYVPH